LPLFEWDGVVVGEASAAWQKAALSRGTARSKGFSRKLKLGRNCCNISVVQQIHCERLLQQSHNQSSWYWFSALAPFAFVSSNVQLPTFPQIQNDILVAGGQQFSVPGEPMPDLGANAESNAGSCKANGWRL